MQAIYLKDGDVVNYTPSSAVDAGQVVVQANLVGIALSPIAANELGSLAVEGIFDVVQAAEIIPAGSTIYWDADGNPVGGVAGTGAATATATGNTFMGFAQALTAATDATVTVALCSAAASANLTATNVTGAVAGSTAAAGSTTADAGALPATAATVFPTTAADDTKGVVVHAVNKVTGRMLFIGNGVANKVLKVYPPSGGAINGAAADAAFSSASGKGVVMVCLSGSGNTWLAW